MSIVADFDAGFVEAGAMVVRKRTGLVFSGARQAQLVNALAAAACHARDRDDYLARLAVESALLDDLVNDITVGETYFFREPEQFARLRQEIIPGFRHLFDRNRPLAVWSAGTASGEEAYSLAIMLHQMGLSAAARVVGTDIASAALARARRARYGLWSLRGVPDGLIRDYFVRHGKQFDLVAMIRDTVEFRALNLADDHYPALFANGAKADLILCRNVLIYFDAPTIAHVARRLIDALAPAGWLLLSVSDPPLEQLVPCQVVPTAAGLMYRRPDHVAHHAETNSMRLAPRALLPPLPPVPTPLRYPVTPMQSTVAGTAAPPSPRQQPAVVATGTAKPSVNENDPAHWIQQVRLLANRGELDAAGRACAAGLDRHRTSAELAYLHAVLLNAAGQYADAAEASRRALYLDRSFTMAHLALGGALARLDDLTGARRAFRNATRLLAVMTPDAIVPASDGEPAGRLAQMAAAQLELLHGKAT